MCPIRPPHLQWGEQWGPTASQPRATRSHGQHRARWAPPSPARGSAGDAPGRRSPPGPRDSLGKPSREGIPAPAWSQRWSGAPDTAPGCEQGLAMGTATPATATPAPHRQQRTPRRKHSPVAHTAPAPRTTRHCQPCLCNSACKSSPGPARPHGSPVAHLPHDPFVTPHTPPCAPRGQCHCRQHPQDAVPWGGSYWGTPEATHHPGPGRSDAGAAPGRRAR